MKVQTIQIRGSNLPPGLVVNAFAGPQTSVGADPFTWRWQTFLKNSRTSKAWMSTEAPISPVVVQPAAQEFFLKLVGTFLSTPIVSAPGLAARSRTGLINAYSAKCKNSWQGPRFFPYLPGSTGSEVQLDLGGSPWVSGAGVSGRVGSVVPGLPDIRSNQPYVLVNSPRFEGVVEIHSAQNEWAPHFDDWLVDPSLEGEDAFSGDLEYLCAPLDYFAKDSEAMAKTSIIHKPIFNVAQIEEEYSFSSGQGLQPITAICSSGAAGSHSYAMVGYADRSSEIQTRLETADVSLPASTYAGEPTFHVPTELVLQRLSTFLPMTAGGQVRAFASPAIFLGACLISTGFSMMGKLPGAFAVDRKYSASGVSHSGPDSWARVLDCIQASPNLLAASPAISSPAWVGLDRYKAQQTPYPSSFSSVMEANPLLAYRDWIFAASTLEMVSADAVTNGGLGAISDELILCSLVNRASRLTPVYHAVAGAPIGEIL